jgi:hypothetical protein
MENIVLEGPSSSSLDSVNIARAEAFLHRGRGFRREPRATPGPRA